MQRIIKEDSKSSNYTSTNFTTSDVSISALNKTVAQIGNTKCQTQAFENHIN